MKSITEDLIKLEIAAIEDALASKTPLVTIFPRDPKHRLAAELLSGHLDGEVRQDLTARRATLRASLCTCGDDPNKGCGYCPNPRAVRPR